MTLEPPVSSLLKGKDCSYESWTHKGAFCVGLIAHPMAAAAPKSCSALHKAEGAALRLYVEVLLVNVDGELERRKARPDLVVIAQNDAW
jgi:hypothetical protein